MLTSPPPSHNNFHSFFYTEQGQKIVLLSYTLSRFGNISFVFGSFYSFLEFLL